MNDNSRSAIDYLLSAAQGFIIIMIFLSVVFVGIYEGLQTHVIEKVEKKYFYPYPYEEVIDKYARQYNVDNSLVAGIILAESRFSPEAKSHRGAIGLMQIMPETGAWIANNINDQGYNENKLYDPETNIHYGVWYLSFLMKEFGNNEILTVAAYNAGHGQIEEWSKLYGWRKNGFYDYTQIPFKETRDYVHRVFDNKKSYQKLYDKK
ncbi:lytic transglycosylase domain-containing protein [Pectinatus cerevisiiphilus]|uniref:Soluble lytic murein transglycosylase n=1 Tax=Pectinatus cerevisiiphilus TaxID=86956 RepID=A0A4R3KGU5_9FIRM|nr:lytic transglycosylase domain-containing protein [Pectinatus cerevisiiphilus]TCS81891.1 soluble lytic murein transglycosylase [Pectinatus cerevisiiphilus]